MLVAVNSICFVLVLGTSLNCYFRKRKFLIYVTLNISFSLLIPQIVFFVLNFDQIEFGLWIKIIIPICIKYNICTILLMFWRLENAWRWTATYWHSKCNKFKMNAYLINLKNSFYKMIIYFFFSNFQESLEFLVEQHVSLELWTNVHKKGICIILTHTIFFKGSIHTCLKIYHFTFLPKVIFGQGQ